MDISAVVLTIKNLLNTTVPVLVSLGLVFFIWGVVQYVIAGGEEAKKKGRDTIVYGIIGLTVVVSMWGLVNIVTKTFGLTDNAPTHPALTSGCTQNSVGILNFDGIPKDEMFQHVAGYITCTIKDSVIPFLFAGALAIFVWGVVKFFIINSDEEAKRSEGKQFMIWGLVALTVMLCVWGLVKVLTNTFGINTSAGIPQTAVQ